MLGDPVPSPRVAEEDSKEFWRWCETNGLAGAMRETNGWPGRVQVDSADKRVLAAELGF